MFYIVILGKQFQNSLQIELFINIAHLPKDSVCLVNAT